MRILAIDPATKCGFAWSDDGRVLPHNVTMFDLKPKRHEGAGMRYLRFADKLREFRPARIYYEEVRRHMGTDAAHIYGGLISQIQVYAERLAVPFMAYPVGTIKKHATGRGNASKLDMIEAAKAKLGYTGNDDNEADALWLLHLALTESGRLKS